MRFLIIFCLLPLMQSCGLHATGHPSNNPVSEQTQSIDDMRNKNDPVNIVRGFYQQQQHLDQFWSVDPATRSMLFSKRLAALFTSNQRKYGQVMITFDPIVNGQDALITDLVVNPSVIHRNRAYVHVHFRNFGHDIAMVYHFIRERDGWKLDEIAAIGGEARWLLSDVLLNP